MPNSPVTPLALRDAVRLPKFKMADCKPEVPVSLVWKEMSTKFQRPPYVCRHAVPTRDTADVARCRSTAEIQNDGAQTGSTPYLWKYLWNGMIYERNSNG
jgi:hypothetical protein